MSRLFAKNQFPEEIDLVFSAYNRKNCGAIYIGNIEAARNLDTLKSKPPATQNWASKPSSLRPRAGSCRTRSPRCRTTCICLPKTMKALTLRPTSKKHTVSLTKI